MKSNMREKTHAFRARPHEVVREYHAERKDTRSRNLGWAGARGKMAPSRHLGAKFVEFKEGQ